MTTDAVAPTIDVDSHVLEPGDIWQRYLEPNFRDRAIQIVRDDEGYENLQIDGHYLKALRGQLGVLGGIDMNKATLFAPGQVTYAESSPLASYDPAERLKVMDAENIDIALLYPTIGICWEGEVRDAQLATAYTRAYNRWIAEFCKINPRRLYPIAHISLLDIEGALAEVVRAKKDGCVGVYLSPDLEARGGKHFDDSTLCRFWDTVQDMEMPVAFHVVVRDRPLIQPWLREAPSDLLFALAFLGIDVMMAFTQVLSCGLMERYPNLKFAILEAGSNWITAWLDRMDHKYDVAPHLIPIKMKPSEYFRRQCVIAVDPDETMTAEVIKHFGPDYFVWASDYPHIDASFKVVYELKRRLASLTADARRKVMGGNAMRFYNLEQTRSEAHEDWMHKQRF